MLILIGVAGVMAVHFNPELAKRRDQQARLAQLQAAVETERQLLAKNLREEEFLRHDPEFLGIIARDRLDLMREGETIYRLDPPRMDKSKMRQIR